MTAAFEPQTLARLRKIRAAVDPLGRFQANHEIVNDEIKDRTS